jgi:RNA polymerase sigma-70 factor (ECF subfamily)
VSAHRNTPEQKTSPDALEDAFELYRAELRRFFSAYAARPQVADDLVQAVALRLIKYRPTEPILDARLYVYRLAWNELHRENGGWRLEKQHMVSCEPQELQQLSDYADRLWLDNSSEAVEQQELDQTFRRLPVVCQVAFLRKNRDGWSYQEIAEELQVTPHTVKKYIVRALTHFRSHFGAADAELE